MRLLKDEEILKAINDGRKANKRDGREGVLLNVSPEYMQDKKYCLKAQYDLCIKDFMTMLKSGHSMDYIMACLDSS